MRSLILYWSAGGNTQKVAQVIERALVENNIDVDVLKISADSDVEIYDYDLVFLGAPSYQWIPPEPVLRFINQMMKKYRRGKMTPRAPQKRHKFAVVFCTYSGVHTGFKEGVTAGKYMAQFLEHLGFLVLDEWYTVGKFHGWEEGNKYGQLGNISERPDANDLDIIYRNTLELLEGIK